MKRFLQGCLVISILFFALGFAGYMETHYTLKGTMYYLSNNEYKIEDTNGNVWIWESDEDFDYDYQFEFKPVHQVKMTMFTNGTDNTITDDEILDIKLVSQE